jgi:hypothetical protein
VKKNVSEEKQMKQITTAAALVAALAGTGGAFAQFEPVRANERFCLETSAGGPGGGGGGSYLCRYVTIEQCMASRTTPGDRCMLNPRLAGQPIR